MFGACVLSAAVACGSFFGGCGRCLVASGSNIRTCGGTRRRVATGQAEGRQRSRPLSNVGRMPLLLKRSEAADCLAEHLSPGGGTTPHPVEHFPPFVFSLPPFKRSLFHIHKTTTEQTQFRQFPKSAAEYIYNLHARRIYNILHERAIIILYFHAHPRAPVPLFFFFLFLFFLFSFPFVLLSFLFLLYYFSFLFAFRLFRFAFRFSFLFFLFFSPRIFATLRRRQGVSPVPSLPPLSPLSLLVCAFHNKTPGGVKRI